MTRDDFEAAVYGHQRMVYGIACGFLNNAALAEEIAQDVFLLLYENLRAVEPGTHCEAWLRRTTIHRCIDASRRSSYRREVTVDVLPEPADTGAFADPLLRERLRRCIASLPETPRAVMVLRFAQDMDVNDIAATLQLPVRTVWSHLQRATALVREKAARSLEENAHGRV
jgi:RNA polymerase sigma-70 factor (ECF subfamily)